MVANTTVQTFMEDEPEMTTVVDTKPEPSLLWKLLMMKMMTQCHTLKNSQRKTN